MAKRRRSASTAQIVRVPSFPRQPAPVIRIQQARAVATRKPKRHHRRRSSSAPSSGKSLIGGAIGGAIFGFLEKTFPTMPTVPFLGRAGTVAVAGYFLMKQGGIGRMGLVRDLTFAAAVIAGHELGKDGKVSGDDLDGEIPAQVRGLASQV